MRLGRALSYFAALSHALFAFANRAMPHSFRDGTPRRRRRPNRDKLSSLEAGRLTRKARRGYLMAPGPIKNPDRYLNSHARSMKALVASLAAR